MIFLYLAGMVTGVAILVRSADWFSDAAVDVARRFHVPEIIVGATLVSLATTLPEFAVSFGAALHGQTDIAVGNAVGSTICNVGLILGLCALLAPMPVAREGFLGSSIALLLLGIVFGILAYLLPEGGVVTGFILLACLGLFLMYSIACSWQRSTPETVPPSMTTTKTAILFVVGAAGVTAGSKLLILCGVGLARLMGISELVIGLTILAVGTSTPEIVVSITGIIKKQRALSIGNIIGANILNLAWVIGASSLVANLPVRHQTRVFDIPVMLLLSVLLLIFGTTGQRLSRAEGAVLFLIYAAYLTALFTVFRVAA